MAIIAPAIVTTPHDGILWLVRWANVTESDTAGPYPVAHKGDKSVNVYGTFGGGTVTIQGSNNPNGSATFSTLRDPLGNTLDTITTTALRQILEAVYQLRPSFAGGLNQSLTVDLLILGR